MEQVGETMSSGDFTISFPEDVIGMTTTVTNGGTITLKYNVTTPLTTGTTVTPYSIGFSPAIGTYVGTLSPLTGWAFFGQPFTREQYDIMADAICSLIARG